MSSSKVAASRGGDTRARVDRLAALRVAADGFYDELSAGLLAASDAENAEVVEFIEYAKRRLEHAQYQAIAAIETSRDATLGPKPREVLANRLRITMREMDHRACVAADLTSGYSITGEPVAPPLPTTAAACSEGAIGDAHIRVIRSFFRELPRAVNVEDHALAEQTLGTWAREMRPDELQKIAHRLAAHLDPDGTLTDEGDRARKRCFTMDRQGADKMTSGRFCADPELAAYLQALFGKYARPGACNPADPTPAVADDPSPEQMKADDRRPQQRMHDALKAVARVALSSTEIGSSRGLPVTTVITMNINDLDNTGGLAHSGDTVVPIVDAMRMARHSHHYLTIFDTNNQPLYCGRSKRIATPAQRIVLHATQKGCSFPGCTKSGYWSQVHHADTDWQHGGQTNIDELCFACDYHHALVTAGIWRTEIAQSGQPDRGRIRWIPPKHIDPNQQPRINRYWFPDDYLTKHLRNINRRRQHSAGVACATRVT